MFKNRPHGSRSLPRSETFGDMMMRAAGYEPIDACQLSPPAALGRDTEGSLRAHQWEAGGDAQWYPRWHVSENS